MLPGRRVDHAVFGGKVLGFERAIIYGDITYPSPYICLYMV